MEKIQFRILLQRFFSNRKRSDSISCGVRLIAAMVAYVHSLPKPFVRNDAFGITVNLFEPKKEFRDENAESEVPSSENWKNEDHINMYTSAKFLIDVLKNNPQILLFTQKFYQKVSDQIIFI